MTEEQHKKKLEQTRRWKSDHPNYQREWRAKNKEKSRTYRRTAYLRRVKENRAYGKSYYQEHKEDCKAKRKKWRQQNPEKIRLRQREWHKKNPHWYRDRARSVKKEVFEHYGLACACCGESHFEFLNIHHIEGGGTKHRDQVKCYGSTFYFWLKRNNFPPEYQTLCWNCNCARGFFGKCPHEREREAQAAD